MEKKELLKSIGFSDEFISHLEKVEEENLYDFNETIIVNVDFSLLNHDTSELTLRNQIMKDTNRLALTQ